jgi:hypothetical protein
LADLRKEEEAVQAVQTYADELQELSKLETLA